MKSLWFVEAFIIATVLSVVGYLTLPEMGFAQTLCR
jgi:hypothetical protein